MKNPMRGTCACLLAAAVAVGCGESPTEPINDVNPALVAAAGESGFAGNTSAGLPQGSVDFIGPNGVPMDMTAKEFVQQATLPNGVVWKTSGIVISAVPDESITDAPFDRMWVTVAHPGSLASVESGTYSFQTPLPPISFTEESLVSFGRVRATGSTSYTLMAPGQVTITSVEYFNDTYTCERPENTTFIFDSCTYQLGILRGTVEFTGTLENGTPIVQPATSFSVPIQRETLIMRMR